MVLEDQKGSYISYGQQQRCHNAMPPPCRNCPLRPPSLRWPFGIALCLSSSSFTHDERLSSPTWPAPRPQSRTRAPMPAPPTPQAPAAAPRTRPFVVVVWPGYPGVPRPQPAAGMGPHRLRPWPPRGTVPRGAPLGHPRWGVKRVVGGMAPCGCALCRGPPVSSWKPRGLLLPRRCTGGITIFLLPVRHAPTTGALVFSTLGDGIWSHCAKRRPVRRCGGQSAVAREWSLGSPPAVGTSGSSAASPSSRERRPPAGPSRDGALAGPGVGRRTRPPSPLPLPRSRSDLAVGGSKIVKWGSSTTTTLAR